MFRTLLLGAASAAAYAPAVMAQGEPPSLQPVIECRSIENDAERLACYDETTSRFASDSGAPERLVVIDLQDAEAIEQDGFGLELPSLPGLSLSIFAAQSELGLEAGAAEASPGEAEAAPSAQAAARQPGRQSADRTPSSGPADVAAPPTRVVERNDEGQIERIAMRIESAEVEGYDTVVLTMANGQVWEIVSGRNLRRIARSIDDSDTAEIRNAALGSFLMQINGRGPAYRVQRRR
jgi:hypothetical protein